MKAAPGAFSFYATPNGVRPSAAIPAESAGAAKGISVAAILDTGNVKLADTTMFLKYPYKLALAPTISASPTIGYTHDSFGSGFYGGTAILLEDMTGATKMAFSFAINGRLEDFVLTAAYGYFGTRMPYIFGFSNIPFYYSRGTVFDANTGLQSTVTTRNLERSVYATGLYPLNTFNRFEVGLCFVSLNRENVVYNFNIYTGQGGRVTSGSNTKNWFEPSLAYVSDNTIQVNYFAPTSGRRYRLQVTPAVGNFNWINGLGDARVYFPVIFNKLIIALHGYASLTTGPDADTLRTYLAYPVAIWGYDGSNFGVAPSCLTLPNPDRCNPVIGSSALWGNFEIRAPIYRGGGGVVPVPPVELFAFWDAGTAWFTGQTVIFARQSKLDPLYQRGLVTSNGVGVRINLFGAAILSWAFVKPYDLYSHPAYLQFSFYAPF